MGDRRYRHRRDDDRASEPAEHARQSAQSSAQPLDSLASPALTAPGSEVARVAALQQAQRQHGNAAVAKLLRTPNAALANAQPQPVAHTTGEDVDAYLDASPFFRELVEESVRGGTRAAGHVHIHDPADFRRVYVEYAMRRNNPATGSPYTRAEAEAKEPRVNAFRDGSEIHLHQNRGEPGTAIHESMHLFSHDDFRRQLGFNANEGATEYFAKKLCAEQGVARGNFYADQYRSIRKLVDKVGEDVLAEAYFHGDIDGIRHALDRRGFFQRVYEFFGGAQQESVFDRWVTFMKAGRYADADALL